MGWRSAFIVTYDANVLVGSRPNRPFARRTASQEPTIAASPHTVTAAARQIQRAS
jgi:hypothetical protein